MSTEAWRVFKANTANHTLDILHDDGLYRHLRMSAGGCRAWSWEIITWPGSLSISGDIGRELIFTRTPDMLDFFRDPRYDDTVAGGGAPCINPGYWGEKTRATDLEVFELGPAMTKVAEHMVSALMHDYLRCGGAICPDEWDENLATCCALIEAWEDFRAACRSDDGNVEQAIISWLMDNPDVGDHDAWEWDLRVWGFDYLLTCYAIVSTVAAWDRRSEANYRCDPTYLEYGVGYYSEDADVAYGILGYDTAAEAAGILEGHRRAGYIDAVTAVRRISRWRTIGYDELAQAADEETD